MSGLKRFFYDGTIEKNKKMVLSQELANHICNVMRLRDGDEILLFDSNGREFLCTIKSQKRRLFAYPHQEITQGGYIPFNITLCQSLIRLPRMDLLIEKTTELGVSVIQPVLAERSNIHLKNAVSRLNRWRKIAAEASRQCGRTIVPEIKEIMKLPDFFKNQNVAGLRILLQKDANNRMQDVLNIYKNEINIIIAVGPEGGFTEEENRTFLSHGFIPVKVGPFTLRAETAGIISVGIITSHPDICQ